VADQLIGAALKDFAAPDIGDMVVVAFKDLLSSM
jgi:hypothetical protein